MIIWLRNLRNGPSWQSVEQFLFEAVAISWLLVLLHTFAFVACGGLNCIHESGHHHFWEQVFGPLVVCISCQQHGHGVCFFIFIFLKFIVLHCYGGSRWVMTNLSSANLAEKMWFLRTGGETGWNGGRSKKGDRWYPMISADTVTIGVYGGPDIMSFTFFFLFLLLLAVEWNNHLSPSIHVFGIGNATYFSRSLKLFKYFFVSRIKVYIYSWVVS